MDNLYYSNVSNLNYANFLNTKFRKYDEKEITLLMQRPTLSYVLYFINYCIKRDNVFGLISSLDYRFVLSLNKDLKILLNEIEDIIDYNVYEKLFTIYLSILNMSDCIKKEKIYEEKTVYFVIENDKVGKYEKQSFVNDDIEDEEIIF